MSHFVLVPGMNHGGWWYAPLVEALESVEGAGHTATAVTLTGLEAEPDVDRRVVLDTHVADVVAAVDAAPAASRTGRDVVLVGHSYGGLPITAAADVRSDVVRALVYLDAFVPQDGDSAWTLTNDEEREWWTTDARRSGDTVDPLPFFDDQARPHPVGTLLQGVRLAGAWRDVPAQVFAEATEWPGETPLRTSIDRAVADDDITVVRWQTRHNVMHDGPGRVLELLRGL
ncbi:alpha/beta fold hydrolase [Nocardioides sp.]|uniref:alpha/beta fold hydrolase n=1 Tax=Nocardioides sp. TaxID=35761 RepID=UPI002717B5C9|nr:alpha/beta fold hydrolase [Nocardioides sp.]MDO9457524.1 alpha/beta fold hydrolase [Nocardioides sp.]